MNASSAPVPTGRVLDYATGQGFISAVGRTVDTRTGEWSAAGVAASLVPGVYRVLPHVISAEPNKRTGRVSRNAGKSTVRVTPALSVAEARVALAEAQAGVTRAEARVADAQDTLSEAIARESESPVAPVAEAPDAAAILAALPADALAALMAQLTGK